MAYIVKYDKKALIEYIKIGQKIPKTNKNLYQGNN